MRIKTGLIYILICLHVLNLGCRDSSPPPRPLITVKEYLQVLAEEHESANEMERYYSKAILAEFEDDGDARPSTGKLIGFSLLIPSRIESVGILYEVVNGDRAEVFGTLVAADEWDEPNLKFDLINEDGKWKIDGLTFVSFQEAVA